MAESSKLDELRDLYERAQRVKDELQIQSWPGQLLFQAFDEYWRVTAVGDGFGGSRVEEVTTDGDDAEAEKLVREQVCTSESEGMALAEAWSDERVEAEYAGTPMDT